MIRRLYLASLVGVAALIPLAAAQAQSSFDSLSPGNQKIARALFDAQVPTQSGPAPLDLNQIADLKGKTGWGRVFQEMKADHLVEAKNLGQVVSGSEHTLSHGAALGAGNSGGALAATGAGHATEGGHANDVDASAHGEGFAHHEDATSITTAGGTSVASAGAVSGGSHGLGIVGGGGGSSGSHAGLGGGSGGGHGH